MHVCVFLCVCEENEIGETALDVSRRLKHNQCEVLVSNDLLDVNLIN